MSKVWFVTGSSRGLGLGIVETVLSKTKDRVVATARKAADLSHLVDKYGSERVLAVSVDVAKNEQVVDAVDQAIKKFGRLDVVVNNAGYADTASLEDMTLESFKAQVDTNFFGVVYVTKAVVPILRKQGSGHIIQVSSIGGRVGSPGLSAYQSAKWAVGGFSTAVAKEVNPLGINVTIVEPGGIKTDWAFSSMGIFPVSEPYEKTVGAFLTIRDQIKDSWSSAEDIANIILEITNVEDPPLHLLAGRDTVDYAKMTANELAASDEKWNHLTVSRV